jgi:hydroxyacylglutathione hydrolase
LGGNAAGYFNTVLLVTQPGKEIESVTRLARVGFDNVLGILKGGFDAWRDAGKRIDMIISIDPYEFSLSITSMMTLKYWMYANPMNLTPAGI